MDRGLSLSWWEHGSVQADMVLEKTQRALYLDGQAARRESDIGPHLSFRNLNTHYP